MKYGKTVKAEFIERENRFVASVRLEDGQHVKVHVKNTGRCRELLVPGCTVYLEDFHGRMGSRKMKYSLVAVEKMNGTCDDVARWGSDTLLINMDSQAPNKVVQEALEESRLVLPGFEPLSENNQVPLYSLIRPETKYGDSRFDFYVERTGDEEGLGDEGHTRKAFIEVKGVTLEEGGFARFPDAPTERGLKHINGLIDAVDEGYRAYVIFVIQMKTIHAFGPNYDTQPEFGEALIRAEEAGVQILAFDCNVRPEGLQLDSRVEISLD